MIAHWLAKSNRIISREDKIFQQATTHSKNHEKEWKGKPVKLFKAEMTIILVIYFMNCVFQNAPCLVKIFWINAYSVLERFYVKIRLHLLLLTKKKKNSITHNSRTQLSCNHILKPPQIKEKWKNNG